MEWLGGLRTGILETILVPKHYRTISTKCIHILISYRSNIHRYTQNYKPRYLAYD